jgi:asparagine synthase (glutamine-hydrolysing)
MCGIVAVVSERKFAIHQFEKMRDAILHRGPDDSGLWQDVEQNVLLGFRRLSILDLSENGHQPMVSKSGRWVIIFNGEIYNHASIRKLLPDHSWRGHSDTEVLIEAIEVFGATELLPKLHGMFAFLAYDTQEKKIILARDRFGEKPLYFGIIENDLVVASDLKCFYGHPRFSLQMDQRSLATYFEYSYIPSGYSIDERVKKLLSASFLEFDVASFKSITNLTPKQYWHPPRDVVSITNDAALLGLENILMEVLEEMMIADVPLGAFLSGGVDSTLIVALMQKISKRAVKTFTIGFKEQEYDESKYAKKIAEFLKTEHYEKILTPDDLLAMLPRVLDAYDEPFADTSAIPTFALCEFARQHVTVALTGDGGDEMFMGYNRYIFGEKMEKLKNLPMVAKYFAVNALNLVPMHIWRLASKMTGMAEIHLKAERVQRFLQSTLDQKSYADHLASMIKTSSTAHQAGVKSYGPRQHSVHKNLVMDLNNQDLLNYLPDDIMTKVDRASMAVSMETRAPYLHPKISEWALRLPKDIRLGTGAMLGKPLLKSLLRRHLSAELFERPKKGFSLPLGPWIQALNHHGKLHRNLSTDMQWKHLLAERFLPH